MLKTSSTNNNIVSRVLVVGAFGYDTNVYLQSNTLDRDQEMEFLEILDFPSHAGVVSSLSYSLLGASVQVMGRIGDDSQGMELRQLLAQANIGLRGLQQDPKGTKRSVNLIFPDGTRKGFYDGKSSMHQSLDYILADNLLQGVDLVHVNIVNWAREILSLAKSMGVPIAVDLQDVRDGWDPYRLDFVKAANFLFFSGTDVVNIEDTIQIYRRLNPEVVMLVGLGSDGCILSTAQHQKRYSALESDLPVVDTTGAGDSLAVAFLLSVLEEYGWDDCVLRAQINARHTCSVKGSHHQLLTRTDWESRYTEHKSEMSSN